MKEVVKEKLYQTRDGRSRLLDELAQLQKEETSLQHRRSRHRENIGKNHAEGDECSALDNELTACISRMKQIVDAISESRPDVAPSPTDLEIVQLGSIVTVRKFANEDDETGTLYTFQLVGHGESAPNGSKAGSFSELPLISYTCPQGAAVIKKRVGDGITVNDSDQEIIMIALATQLQAANAA